MEKINIYEVTRVDMAGNKLQQRLISEVEAIQDLKNRNDLYQNITEQDIEGAFEVIRDNFSKDIHQPCFFFNNSKTIADVYTLIEKQSIH